MKIIYIDMPKTIFITQINNGDIIEFWNVKFNGIIHGSVCLWKLNLKKEYFENR